MQNPIKEMLLAMVDSGIDFVVSGGVAVVLHGVERVTLDLDVSVDMRRDNLEPLLRLMSSRGMVPRVPVSPEILLEEDRRRWMVEEKNALVFTFIDPNDPYRHVDIFLTDDLAYHRLIEDAVKVDVAGREVRVVSRSRLLELKRAVRPPRPKDIFDIAELERLEGER